MIRTVVILLFALCLTSSAEVLFIREGASGANNGLNPTDAWKTTANIVWGSGAGKLGAGDKLKVCGGTYTNLNIQGSGTGTNNLILIEKAKTNDTECTTASGWNDSFDSFVKVVKIMCNTPGNGNYVTIDGKDAYGAGMMVTNNDAGFTNAAETLGAQDTYTINFNNSGAHDLTFLNLNVCGRGTDTQNFGQYINSGEPNAEGRCFSLNNNTGIQATNLTIKYCAIHNMSTIGIVYGYDYVYIQYNAISNNLVGNPNNNHPNCWVGVNDHNVYYLFNTHSNLQVESGWMLCPDSPSNPPVTNLFVFGNVWERFKGTVGRVIESQNVANGPVYAGYNSVATNTGFVNAGNGGTWAAGSWSSNNATEGGQACAFNNNQGGNKTNLTDSAFIDVAHGNWRIATNSVLANAGIALVSPFNVSPFTIDMDGNTRGADGTVDVGAFEAHGSVGISNYTITLAIAPPGTGFTSGAGTFTAGSSRTVSATPNTGYSFTDWTESAVEVSTSADYTFTLNSDRTLSANFAINHYTISPTAGTGGSVSGGCFCPYGASITVNATADTGYTFHNWTESGNQVSTSTSYGFTVTADRTLVANFTANTTPAAPVNAAVHW